MNESSKNRNSTWNRVVSLLVSIGTAVALSACGAVSGGLAKKKVPADVPSTVPDFLKSEIVTSGSARADGFSQLGVLIHLKNSDSTPVRNYKPLYEVVAGAGVLPSDCSTSDINGVSACAVRATQPGIKKMKLTNARVGLEKELVFIPALQSASKLSMSSGALGEASTPAGYRIKLKLQSSISGTDAGTGGGYKVRVLLQGIGD